MALGGYSIFAASNYVRDEQKKMKQALRARDAGTLRNIQKEALDSFNFRLMAIQHVRLRLPSLKEDAISSALADWWASPSPLRAQLLHSPGRKKRTVYTPSQADRIRQSHLLLLLQPIVEFDAPSCLYSPIGAGWLPSVRDTGLHIEAYGPLFFAKTDLRDYYRSLNLEAILAALPLAEKVRRLVRRYLYVSTLTAGGQQVDLPGLPPGANLSPVLAAVPFRDLVRNFLSAKKALGIFAYVDDLVVLHPRLEVVLEQVHRIERWSKAIGVELNQNKSYIGHTSEFTTSVRGAPLPFTNHLMPEFPFLGFQFRHSSGTVQVERHGLGEEFWEWFASVTDIVKATKVAKRRLEQRHLSVTQLRTLIRQERPSSRIEVSLPFE